MTRRSWPMVALWLSASCAVMACRGASATAPDVVFSCQSSADCLDGWWCRDATCVEGRDVPTVDGGATRDAGTPSAIDALDALGEVVLHFDVRRGLEFDDDGGVVAWRATTLDAGLQVIGQALPSRQPHLYEDGLGRPMNQAEVYLQVTGTEAAALAAAVTGPAPHVHVFVASLTSNGSTANAGLTSVYLRDTVTTQAVYGPGVLRDGRVRDLRSQFLPFAGRGFVDGERTLFVYRWYGDDGLTVSAGANTVSVTQSLQPSSNVFGYLAQMGDYQGGLVQGRLQMMLITALPGRTRAQVDAHVDEVLRVMKTDPLYSALVP